jgi:hypothetical protein
MESGADFKQRSEPTTQTDGSCSRAGNPGEYLEQRTFPSPVAANDADDLTVGDVKCDIPERPELPATNNTLRRFIWP